MADDISEKQNEAAAILDAPMNDETNPGYEGVWAKYDAKPQINNTSERTAVTPREEITKQVNQVVEQNQAVRDERSTGKISEMQAEIDRKNAMKKLRRSGL